MPNHFCKSDHIYFVERNSVGGKGTCGNSECWVPAKFNYRSGKSKYIFENKLVNFSSPDLNALYNNVLVSTT